MLSNKWRPVHRSSVSPLSHSAAASSGLVLCTVPYVVGRNEITRHRTLRPYVFYHLVAPAWPLCGPGGRGWPLSPPLVVRPSVVGSR